MVSTGFHFLPHQVTFDWMCFCFSRNVFRRLKQYAPLEGVVSFLAIRLKYLFRLRGLVSLITSIKCIYIVKFLRTA